MISSWDAPGVASAIKEAWTAPSEIAVRQQITDWLGAVDGTLLEIGCGTALFADRIATKQYLGVDSSFAMLALAAPEVNRILAVGEQLPLRDGSVHTVLCAHVLRHLTALEPLLSEIARVATQQIAIVDLLTSGPTRTGREEVAGQTFPNQVWALGSVLQGLRSPPWSGWRLAITALGIQTGILLRKVAG